VREKTTLSGFELVSVIRMKCAYGPSSFIPDSHLVEIEPRDPCYSPARVSYKRMDLFHSQYVQFPEFFIAV